MSCRLCPNPPMNTDRSPAVLGTAGSGRLSATLRDQMLSAEHALIENVTRHLGAISLCLKNHYRMPALALIYCGVDIFAALGRPQAQQHATRHDFLRWCDRYLLPGTDLNCSAIDLYAARCAVLHTYTSKSAMSREGLAREIVYAWGNKASEDLQRVIDMAKMPSKYVVVHIDILASAFDKAVRAFVLEALADPKREADLYVRMKEFFKDTERIFDL
jgi:hypothetical protein